MARVTQKVGDRGSLKWMQHLVLKHPRLLNDALAHAGGLQCNETVTWVSPRQDDDFAEYRDGDFLEQVGLSRLRGQLASYWPQGGPQWDGLGVGSRGTVILIEAKAHLAELGSTCQASQHSRTRIHAALEVTKAAIGASKDANWLEGFYQYANRLAHLQFLRQHGVPASLVFLYFINDMEMKGPTSEAEWRSGLESVATHLGLPSQYKQCGVKDIFIDVKSLG